MEKNSAAPILGLALFAFVLSYCSAFRSQTNVSVCPVSTTSNSVGDTWRTANPSSVSMCAPTSIGSPLDPAAPWVSRSIAERMMRTSDPDAS